MDVINLLINLIDMKNMEEQKKSFPLLVGGWEMNEVLCNGERLYTDSIIKACSHFISGCFCVIDCIKKEFLCISGETGFLFGYTTIEIQAMGHTFYKSVLPEDDRIAFMSLYREGIFFFNKLKENEKYSYVVDTAFYFRKGRKKILVHHKMVPLRLKEGKLWLLLCQFSAGIDKDVDYISFYNQKNAHFHKYSLKKRTWETYVLPSLSVEEKRMIWLYLQKTGISEIASDLCMSQATVKAHRTKLFRKMKVKNMAEASLMALKYNLL